MLSVTPYIADLLTICFEQEETLSYGIEESSESNEKESSELEDDVEQQKIAHKTLVISAIVHVGQHPYFLRITNQKSSVFLEEHTPPPKHFI